MLDVTVEDYLDCAQDVCRFDGLESEFGFYV